MAAPAVGTAGTYLTGASSASAAVAVPSGVAANDVILVFLYKENTETITPPAGFTQVTNSPTSTTGTVTQHSVWWKRATTSDSGTYSFSWTTTAWREGVAVRFTGCLTTGDPTEVDNFASVSTSTTATPAVSGTTNGGDRLLVWGTTSFDGGTISAQPTGFTGQAGAAAGAASSVGVSTATPAAGATGSVSGTWSTPSLLNASLVALLPDIVAVLPPMRPPGRQSPRGNLAPFLGDFTFGLAVLSSAGAGSGAGAANPASVNVQPVTGTAAAGAGVGNAAAAVGAAAGVAAGTGTANPASAATSPNVAAGAATATGAAFAPTAAQGFNASAGAATAGGAANPATVETATIPPPGFTRIHPTIRPDRTIDVDAAELESLTRQGLIVGVPAPAHTIPTDTVVASVHTTLNPAVSVGVGAAELESLTRQGLVVGTPAPRHIPAADQVVAYVHTTIRPGVLVGVGAAELESLTRQGLIIDSGGFGYAHATGAAAAAAVAVAVFPSPATGAGVAHTPVMPGGSAFYALWVTLADSTTDLWATTHATGAAQVVAFTQLLER